LTKTNIQAVIWDMGGVIVRTEDWGPRERWEAQLGLPKLGLTRLVFEGEMGAKAALGQAKNEDVWRWVGKELDLSEDELSRLQEDFWHGDQVDYDLVDFIHSLRRQVKTGMITNAWPEVRGWLENEWGIADAFDVIVTSAEEQIIKPDPEIYHMALNRLGVEPSEAIFIDDFKRNIAGARSVGMHAILFQSPTQIRKDLVERLPTR
jgi:epoxide hydrolase-like predicted phosphatase